MHQDLAPSSATQWLRLLELQDGAPEHFENCTQEALLVWQHSALLDCLVGVECIDVGLVHVSVDADGLR